MYNNIGRRGQAQARKADHTRVQGMNAAPHFIIPGRKGNRYDYRADYPFDAGGIYR